VASQSTPFVENEQDHTPCVPTQLLNSQTGNGAWQG
jgi:hypothetical protein